MSPNSAKKSLKKSSRSTARSQQQSSRQENKEEETNFSLSVCGSSAPICIQQQKNAKENYKYPRSQKKQIRKFESSLPVDKIVFLAERLQLNDELENNTERCTDTKEGYFEGLERQSEELIIPPDLNFYIDLSSLSNANDESDGSCIEFEKSIARENLNPQKEIKSVFQSETETRGEETTTIKSHSACTNSALCKTPYPTFRENDNNSEGAETRTNSRRTCRSDLICFYVNAVNSQSDLTRYIRPCHTCQETCCVCESLVTSQRSLHRHPTSINSDTNRSVEKENKCVETDDLVTGFRSSSCECMRYTPVSSCRQRRNFGCNNCFSSCRCYPDVSFSFKPVSLPPQNENRNIHYSSECLCSCTEPREVDWLHCVGENTVLAYTSSLANAAKSARSLAKDLESILNTFKNGND